VTDSGSVLSISSRFMFSRIAMNSISGVTDAAARVVHLRHVATEIAAGLSRGAACR
jgi:hypothetical protein